MTAGLPAGPRLVKGGNGASGRVPRREDGRDPGRRAAHSVLPETLDNRERSASTF